MARHGRRWFDYLDQRSERGGLCRDTGKWRCVFFGAIARTVLARYDRRTLINKCAGARDRNRTGTPLRTRDFKSWVSTSFTTRAARPDSSIKDARSPFFHSAAMVGAGVGVACALALFRAAFIARDIL